MSKFFDFLKLNNTINNLEWVTANEIKIHALITGLMKTKLTWDVVKTIRKDRSDNLPCTMIYGKYNISQSQYYRISFAGLLPRV